MSEDKPTSASALQPTPDEEPARKNARIALLEALLAEAQRQAVVQEHRPGRHENAPSLSTRPVQNRTTPEARLPHLEPEIQGMAVVLMAAASARTSAPPLPESPVAESTARLEVSELRKAHQALHEKRPPIQGPERTGRGRLLLGMVVLAGIAIAGAVVSNRARMAEEEMSRLPTIVTAPSALRTPIAMAQQSPEDTLAGATPTIAPIQEARHPLFDDSSRIEILPERAASRPALNHKTEPRPTAIRIFRRSTRLHAPRSYARQAFATVRPAMLPRTVPSMRRAPYSPGHLHRTQFALYVPQPRYQAYSPKPRPFFHQSGASSAPKLRKPPRHRQETRIAIPPHAHPGYDEQADKWMDRLP